MNMKKYVLDLEVVSNEALSDIHALIKLRAADPLPEMYPGQFVEVRVENSTSTFLRRPISVNFVDRRKNQLWLLVAAVGEGTRHLMTLQAGDKLNCILPLGHGFTLPESPGERMLLVGGGVGVAPLLFLGSEIHKIGGEPVFLLGAKTKTGLLETDLFKQFGRVCITTEDGSAGEKGFVTQHSVLNEERFDRVATCGPKPMMVSVARYAEQAGIECEASLENSMACGIGACLCCVEKTIDGNIRACQEGPVLNTRKLLWQH
jgi:dihydroorotate dehydrogenase electron transfer subunit